MPNQLIIHELPEPQAHEALPEDIETHAEGLSGLQEAAPEDQTEQDDSQASGTGALEAATKNVHEAFNGKEIEKVLEGIDFSKDKYVFTAMDSYHAQAATGSRNTRTEGDGSVSRGGSIVPAQYYDNKTGAPNKWGDPRQEAHSSGKPVERVGIRESASQIWTQTEQVVRARGLKGMLGMKTKRTVSELKSVEPTYTFDYEFAAPSVKREDSSEADLDVGNRTGQNIRLSLELSKEQATTLSEIISKDPTKARAVLDEFVKQTGDNGKWNAELFDEEGAFHDPGKRYGVEEFVARDVRPHYEAVPDLKPEIIGLVGTAKKPEDASTDESATEERSLG